MNGETAEKLRKIREDIDRDVAHNCCVEKLAKRCKLDVREFRHCFHLLFDDPPKRYIAKARMRWFEELFAENNGSANHYSGWYAGELGFRSVPGFVKFIRRETKMSFSEFVRDRFHGTRK